MSVAVETRDLDALAPPVGPSPGHPVLRWAVLIAAAVLFLSVEYNPGAAWSGERGVASEEMTMSNAEAMARVAQQGTLQRQVPLLLLGAAGVLALLRRGGARLRARGALGWLVVSYAGLLTVSIVWTDDPLLSARRLLAFVLMSAAIAATVRKVTDDEVVHAALLASAGFVAISLGVEVSTGAFHPAAHDYRFSGVFHPNTLATFCAVLALAAAAVAPRSAWRWPAYALAAAALALLVLTRSRTSLVTVLLALTVRWLAAARPSRAIFATVVIAWTACLAALLVGDALLPRVFQALLMERPDSEIRSFTGRTALWDVLLEYVAQRPVLGYGVGGFWTPHHVQEVSRSAGWTAAHAHSTYLEQLLQFGVVGLAMYALASLAGVGRAVARLHRTGAAGPAFMTSLVVYCVAFGALETVEPSPRFLTFLFFWAVAFLAFRDEADDGGSRCAST
jgi:exopolysaccharide production protein ExoQ